MLIRITPRDKFVILFSRLERRDLTVNFLEYYADRVLNKIYSGSI